MSTALVTDAEKLAIKLKHKYVMMEHVLLVLLEKDEIIHMFKTIKVEGDDIRTEVETYLDGMVQRKAIELLKDGSIAVQHTANVKHLLTQEVALKTASRGQANPNLHAFQFILEDRDSYITSVLLKHNVNIEDVVNYINDYNSKKASGQNPDDYRRSLEKYAVNLNELAKSGKIDPLVGRRAEIYDITQIMGRYKKNNTIIVGESGVGKTAVVEGLAMDIVNGNVPDTLVNSTIYSLDITALIAGTKYRGEFEERMKQVIDELSHEQDSILFIDEIHTIMSAGASSDSSTNAANLLKPALARGDLRCIGSTTIEEYRKFFEKDKALVRRFKQVEIREPSINDAIEIIIGAKTNYEGFHGLVVDDEAVIKAVELSARYIRGQLPDKALDVIDDAASRIKLSGNIRNVNIADIEREVAKVAKIPESTVSASEGDKIMRLNEDIKEVIFGQDTAIDEVVSAIKISRSGLREENKPAAAYLFAGPTGVGKTEVAKQIAKTLGVAFVRLDMSEYMERFSISKLIGSPPGYVGYNDGSSGKLIDAIETNPNCVLLIDEIEKAHPDIMNLFLQVMDNASLEAANGKKVSFENVYVIMTTNAGSAVNDKNTLGFVSSTDNFSDQDKIIKRTFTPEFRNRLDSIVKFNALDKSNMRSITDKFLGDLIAQAKKAKDVELTFSDDVVSFLAEKGFDRTMGARPLKRAITDYVKKPLSEALLTTKGGKIEMVMIDGEPKIA